MKIKDFAKIVVPKSFPDSPTDYYPDLKLHRYYKTLGLNPDNGEGYGRIIDILPNGNVMLESGYKSYYHQPSIKEFKPNEIEVVGIVDCNGRVLVAGDIVYIAEHDLMIKAEYIQPTKWTIKYGRHYLGAHFWNAKENRKFSQYFPEGRLWQPK